MAQIQFLILHSLSVKFQELLVSPFLNCVIGKEIFLLFAESKVQISLDCMNFNGGFLS